MNVVDVLDDTHEALMIVGGLVDGIPAARHAMTDPAQRERAREAGDEAAAAWRHLRRVAVLLSDRPRPSLAYDFL